MSPSNITAEMPEGLATYVDGCCAIRALQLALAYWWIFHVQGVSGGSIFICRLKKPPSAAPES